MADGRADVDDENGDVLKPTIGRIVLYCLDCREFAAVVTKTYEHSNSVDLTVFPPPDAPFVGGAINAMSWVPMESAGISNRCWKWPPRV